MSFQLSIFLAVVACVTAAPPPIVPLEKEQPTVIPILSQVDELEPNGTYKFSYEAGNGIKWEEISYEKTLPKVEGRSAGGEDGESTENTEVHVQEGSYSYIAPDGTVISLRYIADENGFRAVGDHLPTAPTFVASPLVVARQKSGRALDVAKEMKTESSPAVPVVVADKVDTAAKSEVKPADSTKEEVLVAEKKPEIATEGSSPSKDSDIVTPKQEVPTDVTTKTTKVETETKAPFVKETSEVSSSEAPISKSGPVDDSSKSTSESA